MKVFMFRATLERLGITGLYSNPRASDEDSYSESLFRTLKYRPEYPPYGFASLSEAAWRSAYGGNEADVFRKTWRVLEGLD